jgi:hypothetical protein
MGLLACILLLQGYGDRHDFWSHYVGPYTLGLGSEAEYWFPSFQGHLRRDDSSGSGRTIDLLRDLDLPRERAIPMFGGGSFYVPISVSRNHKDEVLFTAEYWTRQWKAFTVLRDPESLGDQKYSAGAGVHSRFRLDSVDLAIKARFDDDNYEFRGGFAVLLHVLIGRLEMSTPTVEKEVTVGSVLQGLQVFGEYRPLKYAFAGVSLKGYVNLGNGIDTNMADLQSYLGAEWGPVRLEGGFRFLPYSETRSDGTFRFMLYGPYAAVSLILKF